MNLYVLEKHPRVSHVLFIFDLGSLGTIFGEKFGWDLKESLINYKLKNIDNLLSLSFGIHFFNLKEIGQIILSGMCYKNTLNYD